MFNLDNEVALTVIECKLRSYAFLQKYKYGISVIVTDFLIRFQNHSLIKSLGQSIIIESNSNCHKKFEDLLLKGYTIHRKAKMNYQDGFHKLLRLPTRISDCPFEELIETENGESAKVYSTRKPKKN